MTDVSELLRQLARRGVTLSRNGNRLRFHPRSQMTPELLEALGQHKHTIAKLLERGGDNAHQKPVVTICDVPCFSREGELAVIPTGTKGRLITDLEAEFPDPAEREFWQRLMATHGESGGDMLLVEIAGQVRALAHWAIQRESESP